MHRHHIIPRHAGGTDDPSNIELVTVEEHAERHRLLFEEYGRWQDKVAYLALIEAIGKEEVRWLVCSMARKGRKFGPLTELQKQAIAKRQIGNKNSLGCKHRPRTKEWKLLQSIAQSGIRHQQIRVKCPHCGKEGGTGNLNRYHFNRCKFALDKLTK